jgi:hypothetical protein
MSFENPQGLWLLALGIPILAFHLYKGRIREMAVPMLLFWEQAVVEEERRSALKKLRHRASLILNLAALFILTSAVSLPEVKGITRRKVRYAVILDNSPGMATVEADGRTRAQAAVDRAREFVTSLGHGDQVSVHDLSSSRMAFTSDLQGLAGRMRVERPALRTETRERVVAALAAGEDVTAVLFTDRAPTGVDDFLAQGRLRVARVGAARDNGGWVAGLQIRKPGEKGVTLSLRASGFSREKLAREEVVYFNGKELARSRLTLDPGVPVAREVRIDSSRFPGEQVEEGGLVEVALEPRDALAADDVASFILPPLAPPSVIVFHPGKPSDLLMIALETLKSGGAIGQELSVAPVERYLPNLGEGRIVIFDRVTPPSLPERVMILGAPGKNGVENPTIVDWDRAAPPNRSVDYGKLLVRRSRILEGGQPLIRAGEGPVATWDSRGGRAVVELGFPIEESDIAARPAFLMLLLNFVEWAGTRAFRPEYALGELIRPERPLWFEEGELTYTQGDRVERSRVHRGFPESPPSAGAGFIRMSAQGRSEWAAVNLFDATESDLREPEGAPEGLPLPPPSPWHARMPYAVVAAAAVLVLLLVEGWLYHRALI